jgi:ribonuclease D
MTQIADTNSLDALCRRLRQTPFVTIDTEFIREKTFWPQLCLVQLAGPEEAVVVDALAPELDLQPLFDLLADRSVLKVFHAARQDIEIFHHLTGSVPAPVSDTQVAAMVCGFGDQVGYDRLVAKLAGEQIDKGPRFTDWSLRPLTEKQISYALADVTHLRIIHEKLQRTLEGNGRVSWLQEEMNILTTPETYSADPENAWKRFKLRGGNPRYLALIQGLAAWREREAQARDIPRNRMLRDEAITEIAASRPRDADALSRTRALPRSVAQGNIGAAILATVELAMSLPSSELPSPVPKIDLPRGLGPVTDLLRVLLKMRCDESGVAPKLVAGSADLERIAADDEAPVPALHGWRRELFGEDALALKHGRIALTADGKRMKIVPTGVAADTPAGS